MIYYAGIGSRKTPPDILDEMIAFGQFAAAHMAVLRSGAADGADSAFETGAMLWGGHTEIFLPWKEFNQHPSTMFPPSADAFKLAADIHPAWNRLSKPAKLLVARNMHQVLGYSLRSPVKFVICYTPDGCESHETYSHRTGGTGTAIKLASLNNIPIFNLALSNRLADSKAYLLSLKGDQSHDKASNPEDREEHQEDSNDVRPTA